MKVKFKKLSDQAVTPSYAKPGDAGLDLTVTRICDSDDKPFNIQNVKSTDNTAMIIYHTDIAVEIPTGFVGLIFPRSSISKKPMTLANCVGVIDSGYRGEVQVRMKLDAPGIGRILADFLKTGTTNGKSVFKDIYQVGDKVAQLVIIPYPEVELEEVSELSSTERGEGGFGSTNK